ncbi:MAG: NAD kinase [Chlamydiales bacterium]|nr:NAD kinase [Chlamydiales bacterium]MCH9620065.1 NAD kinase [Chlamydiales bacterium]MCH9623516.1 NAD kinase [Chlamydiales bacterium]
MKIALFANMKKRAAFDVAVVVRDFFKEKKVDLVTGEDGAKELDLPPINTVDPQKIDFLISIGGDGTILRVLHNHPELAAPILGINLGHLGFMADIPLPDLIPSLEDLIGGSYTIQERIVMEGVCPDDKRCFAINEMVIHRAKNPSLIDLSIHVDGTYLNTFSADGIILSTPSGSTAYSLAAGGPILSPEIEAFVITPICPHTISNRPIVLMPSQQIEVQYQSPYDPVEITYDGISRNTMATNEIFTVSRAKRTIKMIKLHRTDNFSTLRTKLNWSGQVRNKIG